MNDPLLIWMLKSRCASPKLLKFSPTLKLNLSISFSLMETGGFACPGLFTPLSAGRTSHCTSVKMYLVNWGLRQREKAIPTPQPSGSPAGDMREAGAREKQHTQLCHSASPKTPLPGEGTPAPPGVIPARHHLLLLLPPPLSTPNKRRFSPSRISGTATAVPGEDAQSRPKGAGRPFPSPGRAGGRGKERKGRGSGAARCPPARASRPRASPLSRGLLAGAAAPAGGAARPPARQQRASHPSRRFPALRPFLSLLAEERHRRLPQAHRSGPGRGPNRGQAPPQAPETGEAGPSAEGGGTMSRRGRGHAPLRSGACFRGGVYPTAPSVARRRGIVNLIKGRGTRCSATGRVSVAPRCCRCRLGPRHATIRPGRGVRAERPNSAGG